MPLPGNRHGICIAAAERDPASCFRPNADPAGIGEALSSAEQPGPARRWLLHPDRDDGNAGVAGELVCLTDLHIRRRLHQLASSGRDRGCKLPVPDPEAAGSDRDDRREPTELGAGPKTVRGLLHRLEDASTHCSLRSDDLGAFVP